METKICPVCSIEFNKRTTYCSRKCWNSVPVSIETKQKMSAASKGKPKSDGMRKALSEATIGVPKPWQQGENNVNYGGVYSSNPEVHAKFLEAVKERGQPWTDEHRSAHSQLMLGETNAMRGKNHTEEYKKEMSEIKKQQYKDGIVVFNLSKISKAEKEIALFFDENKILYEKQFHIPGVPYWYDFYIPSINLIIEYQGDYWHANPVKYASGSKLNLINKGAVLVNDIWARDKLKREAAINNGYKFIAIWESEYKQFGMKVIEKCLS